MHASGVTEPIAPQLQGSKEQGEGRAQAGAELGDVMVAAVEELRNACLVAARACMHQRRAAAHILPAQHSALRTDPSPSAPACMLP